MTQRPTGPLASGTLAPDPLAVTQAFDAPIDADAARAVGTAATVAALASRASISSAITGATVAASERGEASAPSTRGDPPTSEPTGGIHLRPFGPYSIVEPLARQGAMGLVARGYNDGFGRWELLKFLRVEHAREPEMVRQFQREGRVLARLSHPNVVQVFAIYALDGQPCLAMEFLEGSSLEEHASSAGGRLPVERWHELFLAAARGLAAAHEVGLLHRDLKPGNLFVLDGRKAGVGLKLIDFGMATADRARADLTARDDALVAGVSGGTPSFMAPELWRDQDASPSTDLFALGVTFFEVAAGRLPYAACNTVFELALKICDDEPFVDLRDLRPDVPPALAAIVRRAMAKHPEDRFATADELVAALATAAHAARPRKVPGAGPYRGLGSFTASERDVFFGRDAEIAEALERLRSQSGLLLVGPSGSGKSSLAHAGLVPAIEDGALGGGLIYRAAGFEPRAHPLPSLAAAVARLVTTPEADLLALLRAAPDTLGAELRARLPAGSGALVVVDQLEEVATLCDDRDEVLAFCRALASLAQVAAPELKLLSTLRADLMDRLFGLEPLRPLLTRGFYPVRPLRGEALRGALVSPAQAAGYALEDPTIADAIVADVGRTEAGLPLASFAMAAWWQARDEVRKVLPTAAWQALGGLTGALVHHGDGVLASMTPDERSAAEKLLQRLVTADGTRAHVPTATLVDPAASGPHTARALQRLVQAKLVVETSGDATLVHEALITRWPALRALLLASGDDRAFLERVAAAAREWQAQGRPDGALWTADQATRLLRWFEATATTPGQTELAFVEATRRRVSIRRLLSRSLVLTLALVALSTTLYTSQGRRELSHRLAATTAHLARVEADFRKADAARLRAVAERQVTEDPYAALASAFESHERKPDPALDLVAWQARIGGLPFALPGHAGGATLGAASADLPWLATAGADGAVRVLSLQSPERRALRASRDDEDRPTALAFGPTALAVGTRGGELTMASPPTFSPHRIGTCQGRVERVAWVSPSAFVALCAGQSAGHDTASVVRVDTTTRTVTTLSQGKVVDLATGSAGVFVARADGAIDAFDAAATGPATRVSTPHLVGVTRIALAPQGASIAVATTDGTTLLARLVDGHPGAFVAQAERTPGPALALAFGTRDALVAIGSDRVARVWAGGAVHLVEVGSPVVGGSAPRDLLFLTGRTHDLLTVSTLTGEIVGRTPGAKDELSSITTTLSDRWVVTTSLDGGVRAVSLDDAVSRVARGPIAPAPTSCQISPDGSAQACLVSDGVRVAPMVGAATSTAERVQALPPKHRATHVAVSDRGEVVTWAGPGQWGVGDARREGLDDPMALAASPRWAALGGRRADGGAEVRVVAARSDAAEHVVPLDSPLRALCFARDGGRLFVALDDGQVLALDPTTASIVDRRRVETAKGDVPATLAVSDDASLLAVGTRAGAVYTLPPPTGRRGPLARLAGAVTCLAWAQWPRALVAASAESPRIELLDLDTASPLVVGGGASPVQSCARSPIDDRFSFSLRSGAAFLRMIDTAPLTMSSPPDPTLAPLVMSPDAWRGFPTLWR